jgi:hypothetical protein
LRKPVVTAMAITSAITPAATPSTEMAVITEITVPCGGPAGSGWR